MLDEWRKSVRSEFVITFYGEPETSHEIETQSVIDCINAMTLALQRANIVLNGKESDLYVKIKGSPKEGSLEIDIVTLLSCGTITAFLNLVELMGLAGNISVLGGTSLFGLLKELKNREIESTQEFTDNSGNNCVNINVVGDNNPIVISQPVYNLYLDPGTRKEVEAIPSSLNNGIKKISFSNEDNQPLTITSEEKSYFSGIEISDTNETSQILILEIIQSRQDGSSKGWRFSSGDSEFRADILDKSFLNLIISKKISITHGDVIKANVNTIQRQGVRLTSDREITKVISFNGNLIEKGHEIGQMTFNSFTT